MDLKGLPHALLHLPRPHNLEPGAQGGGAQGAFTWGVVDALLDQPDIEIGRVSGTSGGALNGAALVTGS
ncbi:patatin-like phospholipase family protein [Variovorax sp. J22P271]|uniref:patatin-like phospholipase family protein n=1 Tax=Variovorax davisae TaxID=3053515 RepID=UPI002574C9ED|nr:patatin-like phospholipase family protein [Variovorax sp. J22P271]MDM0032145.1 patatin-like phospholipase family protein [Variovorax sp. J22P271]